MPLAMLLKKSAVVKSAASVWQGPCGEGPQGGITQGLLARYFVCGERFRIHAVEGLRPAEGFNHRLEYGNMWHVCEEALASCGMSKGTQEVHVRPLTAHAKSLCIKHPLQQQDVDKWYNVCRAQFPLYVDWWSKHPDVKDRSPLLAEKVFDVPYPLPSGRVVRLRGKWDSVDLIGKGKNAGVWLQENKSKGDIDEPQLRRQLSSGFDLQTMTYCTALQLELEQESKDGFPKGRLAGVRYNVIRRPLSGGRGSISQREATQGSRCNLKCCKDAPSPTCEKCGGTGRVGAKPAETAAEFSERLPGIIKDAHGPEWGMPVGEHFFFMRWNVNVLPVDIARFRRECLDPVLENLCDDFEFWSWCKENDCGVWDMGARNHRVDGFRHRRRHFVLPFGVYNPIAEGGSSDLDEFLRTGSEVGLHRTTDLFSELR